MSDSGQSNWCPPPQPERSAQDRGQLRGSTPPASSLCHFGWRPIILTGFLRDFLIQHFSTAQHIEEPDLRNLIWQDSAASGIMIESLYRWRPEMTEKRPAILVKRNAYQNQRVTLMDRAGVDGQGNDHYQTLWIGSHTLFCVWSTGASCEILATEVQRELTQFAPEITRQLGLFRFQVSEVGTISEVEESTTNFVVPVSVAWCYQEAWKLAPDALPLKGINFELNALLR